MEFFKRNIMYPRKRTAETSQEIDRRFAAYAAHIRSIRESLPAGARALSSWSFHDATIEQVQRVSKYEIDLVIESGGFDILSKTELEYGTYTLSFTGIKKAWVPDTIVHDTWLYEEMSLSDIAAFDYQVLLVNDEIRIQADEVVLTQNSKWTYKSR
jgi:hypothetical protein